MAPSAESQSTTVVAGWPEIERGVRLFAERHAAAEFFAPVHYDVHTV